MGISRHLTIHIHIRNTEIKQQIPLTTNSLSAVTKTKQYRHIHICTAKAAQVITLAKAKMTLTHLPYSGSNRI